MALINSDKRFDSIDQLRGLVIVLMALDHVRDFYSPFSYAPENIDQTSAALFFTRWVTHFCAPVFVFLAGTSAYLYQKKVHSKRALANFLFSRGIWLVFVEIVIINFFWKFNFSPWIFLQVIWVLGVSMIALAGIIYLPRWCAWGIAASMILLHNLLDGIDIQQFGGVDWLWAILHQPYWIALNQKGAGIYLAYPLIPWVAVMLLGYLSGRWYFKSADTAPKKLIYSGLLLCGIFLCMRYINIYGDPTPWSWQSRGEIYSLLSFLNTQKYPPSLAYLTMTLGPALIILGWLQRSKPDYLHILTIFGRVPFFFYVAHIPMIHLTATAYFYLLYEVDTGWQMAGVGAFPVGYEPSLGLTYLVWFLIVFSLFYCCRWYLNFKRHHNHWILKYL